MVKAVFSLVVMTEKGMMQPRRRYLFLIEGGMRILAFPLGLEPAAL